MDACRQKNRQTKRIDAAAMARYSTIRRIETAARGVQEPNR